MSFLFSSHDEFEESSDEPMSFAEAARRRWAEWDEEGDETDI